MNNPSFDFISDWEPFMFITILSGVVCWDMYMGFEKLIAITKVVLSKDLTFQVKLKVELSFAVLMIWPLGMGAG